jgi:hypothetical protein
MTRNGPAGSQNEQEMYARSFAGLQFKELSL